MANKVVMVVSLAVSACGGGSGGPCGDAVGHMIDVSMNDGSERKHKPDPEYMEKASAAVKGALTDLCQKDKWSQEILDCFKSAADYKAAHACEAKFEPGQQKAAEEAIAKALESVPKPSKK
jgi:hypothetical protein